jgi:hypothetical protein
MRSVSEGVTNILKFLSDKASSQTEKKTTVKAPDATPVLKIRDYEYIASTHRSPSPTGKRKSYIPPAMPNQYHGPRYIDARSMRRSMGLEDRIFPVEEDSEKEAYVSVKKREAAKTSTKRDKKGKSKSDGKRSERDSDEHNSYGTLNELFRNQPSKRNVDHGDSSDPSSSSSDSSSASSSTKSSKSRHKHGKYKKKKSTEKPTAMDRFAKIARTVTNGVYMTHQQPSFEHIVLKACTYPHA